MPKECRGCGQTLSLTQFYRHKKMASGRLNFCKTCVKNRVKAHRKENDYVREYDRKRNSTPDRRAHLRKNAKLWRKKNPAKYRAQTALNNAVRDGKITKLPCEICGNKTVHAHHDNYDKPLKVRWLCALHHQRHHAEINS